MKFHVHKSLLEARDAYRVSFFAHPPFEGTRCAIQDTSPSMEKLETDIRPIILLKRVRKFFGVLGTGNKSDLCVYWFDLVPEVQGDPWTKCSEKKMKICDKYVPPEEEFE